MVPLGALLVMLVTYGSRRHYPQHLYFTLHSQAAVFAGLTLIALLPQAPRSGTGPGWTAGWETSPASLAGAAIMATVTVYVTMAFRRVYGGGWIVNVARPLLIALVYIVVILTAQFAMIAIVDAR